MRILFIGNKTSTHFIKWVDYFRDKHTIRTAETYFETKKAIEIGPDIVHAHYAGRYGLFGALLNYHPFILTLWGSDFIINRQSWWKNPLLNYQLKKADLITTDSQRFIALLGPHRRKTELIQFGVDGTKFKPDLAFEHNTPVVVTLNRQTANLALFYEAAKLFPRAQFTVLQNLPQHKIPYYLNTAWIYVDISTSDAGLSMGTAEAMACGKPVVIPDHCDNAHWVSPEQLYVPGDIVTLTEQIKYFLDKDSHREYTGVDNRRMMVAHYNYKDEMSRMEKIYKSLV